MTAGRHRWLLSLLLAGGLGAAAAAIAAEAVQPAGLPDLARGKQAALEGRTRDAERDLLPLAERGYPDAQLALARLHARSDDPAQRLQAVFWYREALPTLRREVAAPLAQLLLQDGREIALDEAEPLLQEAHSQYRDPEALVGLLRLYATHPQREGATQAPALAAEAESLDDPRMKAALAGWYRSRPDLEGHIGKLAALCRDALSLIPQCYVDLVRQQRDAGEPEPLQELISRAAEQYRQGSLPAGIAGSLARLVIEPPAGTDPEAGEAAVRVSDVPETEGEPTAPTAEATACDAPLLQTSSASTPAQALPETAAATGHPELAAPLLDALATGPLEGQVLAAGMVVRRPQLLPDFDARAVLEEGLDRQLPDSALHLGILHLQGERVPRDPQAAERYLQQAAQSPEPAVAQYYLGRLYQSGYLDEVDGLAAAQHLLAAARSGHAGADAAMARLYSAGKGVCPDLRNAYVFARLAAEQGNTTAQPLMQQLRAALTIDRQIEADAIYAQEEAFRSQLGVAREQARTSQQTGDPS